MSSSRPRASPLHMSVSVPDDGAGSWDSSDNSNANMNPGDRESSPESSSRYTTDQYDGYDGAFPLPDDMEIPETRQLRWEREALVQSKFASGDDAMFRTMRSATPMAKEAANRWTDNVFALKSWVEQKTSSRDETRERMRTRRGTAGGGGGVT